MNESKYTVVQSASWTDGEPDTLYVSVETDSTDGEAFVVFSGNATWLNPNQAFEVAEYVKDCARRAAAINQQNFLVDRVAEIMEFGYTQWSDEKINASIDYRSNQEG